MLASLLRSLVVGTSLLGLAASPALAKDFKVGVIYDLTGPLAAGGSKAAAIGTQIAIDMINERGGVEGYKIVPTTADAQSKTDVAINEAERLLNDTKVDMLMGVYSSGQCVPLAAKIDTAKKFFWANVCVASSVFKNRNLKYVFRAQVHSDLYGRTSCDFLAENAKSKLKMDVKDIRIAIINEDGPYGSGIASANKERCSELGMKIVHEEAYSATATDLSAMVTKLRRARPDIILHTGYNPDITLFLRQSKEAGLKWKALIGHGAGYGQIDKLAGTFGKDANYIFDVDPVAAQLLDPKTLKPGLGDLTAELVKRYKAQTGASEVPPHASMGFNQSWIFFTDVMPRAIKKYGGVDPEALRKATLDTDIPAGGTIQGYGVKFYAPGSPMSGQNERASLVILQYVDGVTKVVYPTAIKTFDAVLPLPAGIAFAK